ncbi:MAG TPA: GMP synthase subunit A [Methanobacteriaceae archaeon]|nr:GMP synthase subunit A [Methanobacteriaceae archaeon]HNS25524.1 GMP synthase subunit A [Methanobacteriaceae archaeon]
MKILVVNNHGQYNHRIYRSLHYLKIPAEIIPNSTSLEKVEEKDPAGLILGGGPSLERSGNSSLYIKELDCPILGICLGHQIMAKTFGAEVKTAEIESYAQIEINILRENDIFKGLGPSMKVWASHKDEVCALPEQFEVLADSYVCDIEAMKHLKKPLYSIQFHPEVYHTPNGPRLFKNFYEVCKG